MINLDSFGDGLTAVVIGASGGIGGAFADLLEAAPEVSRFHRLSRSSDPPLDLTDEASIEAAAAAIEGPVHLVIVATGLLHEGDMRPEKTWRSLDAETMAHAFRVNAIGPALVARHFLPLLAKDRKTVFAALSARVGSISDNRLGGWYAYRASKAALNMLIRTLSVELARRNPDAVIAGLHPGTVDTALSKPFQSAVPDGGLFRPEDAACDMLSVLNGLETGQSGGLFAYDGEEIAP